MKTDPSLLIDGDENNECEVRPNSEAAKVDRRCLLLYGNRPRSFAAKCTPCHAPTRHEKYPSRRLRHAEQDVIDTRLVCCRAKIYGAGRPHKLDRNLREVAEIAVWITDAPLIVLGCQADAAQQSDLTRAQRLP